MKKKKSSWERNELVFLVSYAILFYVVVIHRSIQIANDHRGKLYGLRTGLVADRLVDASDAQWRNFRSNLPILSSVFLIFTAVANISRSCFQLKARGVAIVWLLISLAYLSYLHGACVIFILGIALTNYLLTKIFARTKYFSSVIWVYNISFLICNRVYGGYSFSSFGNKLAFLDSFRGTFRWQICFNFVILRMISFGYDYHWAHQESHFDHEKHILRCHICKLGKTCYHVLQETSVSNDKFSFSIYLCYLLYAPLYIAGPILSFNAFTSQLDIAWNKNSTKDVAWYGIRWLFSLFLMELMSHLFYYNAFAISGLWKQLSPADVFIIGYGVLNFMWLKFFLIWRYFRLWSLINGIEAPENMPKCINNCYNFQSFWKNWHASFNKWLVRYMYIPLGGSQRKLFNVWFIFTFVAVWHDLEWKLLSWAWLTCIFFVPEMIMQSLANKLQPESVVGQFIFREVSALAGAVTISCLMVANLVGFVVGPSGINWLITQFISKEGLPILGVIFFSFYIATKLMFQIHDAKERSLTETRSK